MRGQQTHRRALPARQTPESRRLRPLQLAFVNAASALPCRPAPRSAFDNAARRDNPSRPWHAFADPLRAVAAAARAQGGACVDETEERLTLVVLAFLEYVLEPLDTRPAGDVVYLQLVREEAQALEAQALARGLGTAEARAEAVRETEEALAVGQIYVTHERLQLDSRSVRLIR